MRGENTSIAAAIAVCNNTPPHAWGKHLRRPYSCRRRRYTPTCVGKTGLEQRHKNSNKVHPHVRGENSHLMRENKLQYGTPPRAWGKLPLKIGVKAKLRYTPTCVGKTMYSDAERIPNIWYTPRAWGNLIAGGKIKRARYTVRGKTSKRPPQNHRYRYTPCVGKTLLF